MMVSCQFAHNKFLAPKFIISYLTRNSLLNVDFGLTHDDKMRRTAKSWIQLETRTHQTLLGTAHCLPEKNLNRVAIRIVHWCFEFIVTHEL